MRDERKREEELPLIDLDPDPSGTRARRKSSGGRGGLERKKFHFRSGSFRSEKPRNQNQTTTNTFSKINQQTKLKNHNGKELEVKEPRPIVVYGSGGQRQMIEAGGALVWVSCSGMEVKICGGGCGCELVNGCGCEREEEIVGVMVVDQFGYFEFVKI